MDLCVWKEAVRKDAYQKAMRSYNRDEGRVCTKKREDIFIVKRGERRGVRVYQQTIEKGVY